jgi:hypothetical protein
MSQIAISPKASIEITEHGAIITGSLSEKEWVHAMRTMRDVNRNYLKALGDIISYGTRAFGENVVGQHIEQLEFDLNEANTALGISQIGYDFKKAYPLTPEHFYTLSKLKNDEQREKWAKLCVEHKLNALDLKRSIEAGEVITNENVGKTSGLGSGITTIEGSVFQFSQWKKSVGEDTILTWEQERRIELLNKLEPIIDLATKIHDTLQLQD